jgi:hypothetical protein
MPFSKSIDDAHDIVSADDAGKWDSIARCQDVVMHQGRLIFPQATSDGYDGGLALSPWAMAQACTRLGLPTAYFKRCPAHLQDANFNHWNQSHEVLRQFSKADVDPDEAWLLRVKGATVRGVLSPRYARLDNRQLMDTLLPMLRHRNFKVGLLQLTGEALHLRLVDPTIGREVLPDDRLMVGIHLANSEVGLRAVTVDALVFRLVCTNGLIRRLNHKSLLKQRHIHVDEARFGGMLQDAIQEAVIVAAGFIEQMALAIKIPVPAPDKAIDLLGQMWNLPKSTVEMVKFTLMGEAKAETLYGLVNALTQSAQRLGIEERVELETLSSVLIDTTSTTAADQQLRAQILSGAL